MRSPGARQCGNQQLAAHFKLSKTQTRIDLVNRFVRQFGKDCLAGLLCDREFVGKDWFAYLKSAEIPFFIRM